MLNDIRLYVNLVLLIPLSIVKSLVISTNKPHFLMQS